MTSISPWIVTIEALRPYTIELEKQIPEPFPYLREKKLFLKFFYI
jgi:fumarylacetoacetase